MKGRPGSPSDLERRARRTVVRQLDASDCGAACLAWVVRFYGGEEPVERLRTLSGTTGAGVTLLGLHQAAGAVGLVSEAYEGRLSDLLRLDTPAVLHLHVKGELQHFVVCFGCAGRSMLIGDPAVGLRTMSQDEVEEAWRSRALVTLRPGTRFVDVRRRSADRRRWLFEAVREDAGSLLMAAVLGGIISALGLCVALFSKVLIDDILPHDEVSKLVVGLVLLSLVLVVQAGIGVARSKLLLRQARAFNVRIAGRFLSDLLRLPVPFFSSRRTGDLIARLNDTARLQRAVTNVLGNVVVEVLVLLFGLVFLSVFSPVAAAAVGIMLAASLAASWRFHGPIVEGQHEVMSAHARSESAFIEAILGIGALKASNAETVFTGLLRDTYADMQQAAFTLGSVGIAFGFVLDLLGTVLVAGVLAWSSALVLDGLIAMGTLVAMLQVTGTIVPAARALATANIDIQEAAVAFDRMYQLTSLRPEYDATLEADKSAIRAVRRLDVDRVTFRYPGRPALLEDVSFACARGELVLIVGRSGSGKTSLLQILQRFIVPEMGCARINGCEWDDLSIPSWRSVLGVMPQRIQIFTGSLLDNIRLGMASDDVSVEAACRKLGFTHCFDVLPAGYRTIVGEGGITLSGGQRQLVGLARALVRTPEVLLLDEPTASMDDDTAAFAMDVVDRWKRNRIVIAASHAPVLRCRASRIYRIDGGQMVLEEEPEGRRARVP